MPTSRLEAFSDGVLAIIITIMVLGLRQPEGDSLAALWDTTGLALLTYLLSFVYVGIYWNNHHHLLQSVERVTGGALWANLNLLFWLSLMPFTTAWMDATRFSRVPVLAYGVILLTSALAYLVLEHTLLRGEASDSPLRRALLGDSERSVGAERKGAASLGIYLIGIAAVALEGILLPPHVGTATALACFVVVALWWLVPDRRLEPPRPRGQGGSDNDRRI